MKARYEQQKYKQEILVLKSTHKDRMKVWISSIARDTPYTRYSLCAVLMAVDGAVNRGIVRTKQGNHITTPKAYRQLGAPSFEDYGCITSAAELSKSYNCMKSVDLHERIEFLAECGLLEFETYKPKLKRQRQRAHPYWYTKLRITEKGRKYIEMYSEMLNIMLECFPDSKKHI